MGILHCFWSIDCWDLLLFTVLLLLLLYRQSSPEAVLYSYLSLVGPRVVWKEPSGENMLSYLNDFTAHINDFDWGHEQKDDI